MSSVEAGAWIWRPISPFDYTLIQEVLRGIVERLSPEQQTLICEMIEDCEREAEAFELSQLNHKTAFAVLADLRDWIDGEDGSHIIEWQHNNIKNQK